MNHQDYLNTDQAAGYVKLAASTLTKKRLFGDGPPFFKIGRRVVYRRADLDAWLSAHRRTSTSDAGETA